MAHPTFWVPVGCAVRTTPSRYIAILIIMLALSACNSSSDETSQAPDVDTLLRTIIETNHLTGDPSTGRSIPSIEDPLAQLGMKLFFTKALGGQFDSACVTCHHPYLGGGDGLSLGIGSGAEIPDLLGPGRAHSNVAAHFDGGPTVPRNSPTTFNAALWDTSMFWDGKVESLGKTPGANGNDGFGIRTPETPMGTADVRAGFDLPEAQARFPVTSPVEMRGFEFEADGDNHSLRNHLAQRIGGYGDAALELATNHWLQAFQSAFNSVQPAETLITFDRIVQAISAYERSQLFIETPWKHYIDGDTDAIGLSAKRGAVLFYTSIEEGGAGCAVCHMGDFFTDGQYHAIATVQIGRGKGNGDFGDDDFGRFNISGDLKDLYAFRTPTLLNVEVTGPWGHAGSYLTLESIVRHYINPRESLALYDFNQLAPGTQIDHAYENTTVALDHLDLLRETKKTLFNENAVLDDMQVDDIVMFVTALTDSCVKSRACLDAWVPDETVWDPDGLRINALGRLD